MDYLVVKDELCYYLKLVIAYAIENRNCKYDGDILSTVSQLDAFLLKKGVVKKPVLEMTKEELIKSIDWQHEILKRKRNYYAAKQTKQLLEELNLTVQN